MATKKATKKKASAVVEPTSYDLVISPIGYFNKREITNQDPRALVSGSRNMRINDSDKAESRPGFTLDGQAKTVNEKIDSNYDFVTKEGTKNLRAFQGATADNGKLQVRVDNGTTIGWYDLLTGLTSTDFDFTTWWDDGEDTRLMIFVDGTEDIRSWGGGVGIVASNTSDSITISGDMTFAELGFLFSDNDQVIIPGVGTFAYDPESISTKTLVLELDEDEFLPTLTVGSPIFQGVNDQNITDGDKNIIISDIVMTKDNQVWYGYTKSSVIWGSKDTAFNDVSFTTPVPLPGDGFKIVLDNFTVGFIQQDTDVFVFAGLDDLYQIDIVQDSFVSTDDTSDPQYQQSITVTKLRTGAGQAAISKKAIIPVKNGIMYLTNEKTLTWLTNVENVFTPQALPTSDPIKTDFDNIDMRDARGIFFENEVWICFPRANLTYVYSFNKQLWQTPYTLPLSGFSIIKNEKTQQNELFGHSNSVNETYKLNDGLSDNGVRIEFFAAFAYRQFGDRSILHQFDEYFSELYMSSSTIVTCYHRYEYKGSELIIPKDIDGGDKGLKFAPSGDGDLGKNNLGKNPLGSILDAVDLLAKYRCIHEMKLVDFFEHQIIYGSDSPNAQFQILAHGPNIRPSTNIARSIKR